MGLSVIALFGPLFDPATQKTNALQGQSRASILCDDVPSECEPVDTTTTSGALLQTDDYWVVKRPIALLGPFPTQKEP
jgi:hypothetical protein